MSSKILKQVNTGKQAKFNHGVEALKRAGRELNSQNDQGPGS